MIYPNKTGGFTLARKKDFGKLDEEMEQTINQLKTDQRTLKPSQFPHGAIMESAARPVNDLFSIPIDQFVTFRQKGDGDFSPWSEDEIKEMAEKMDEDGAYEPILVRQIETNKYEILSGEQRYRSSMLKGLKSLRAIVFRDCSDEKAMDIFLLTNLHRRTSRISDSIYGWSMFAKTHPKIKNSDDLNDAIAITEIANSEKMPITLTQYYRYVKMSNLIKEWIQALDDRRLSIRSGYELAHFSPEEQKRLMPYASFFSEEKLNQLRKQKKENSFDLTPEFLDDFFLRHVPKKKETDNRLRSSLRNIRAEIVKSINPEFYDDVGSIVKEALEEYLKKNPQYKS